MIPVAIQTFFAEHAVLMQIVGTALVVLAIGRSARRARPRVLAGWTHSTYTGALKTLALLGAAFVTAAVVYNGLSIFRLGWLTPAFLLTVAAAYLLAYEVFLARLRWNETEVEVRRPPFGPRTMRFQDIVAIQFHSASVSVTLTSRAGDRLWFPYGYRVGARALLAKILPRNDAAAGRSATEDFEET